MMHIITALAKFRLRLTDFESQDDRSPSCGLREHPDREL